MSGANIVWHAGEEIQLGPFFQASQGSDFEASIVPCGTLKPINVYTEERVWRYDSIEYEDSNIELSLYPNPTTDVVNVKSKLPIIEIEIFNLQGQLIKTLPYSNEFHVASLSNGIYVLNFKINSSPSIRIKLIKN